MFDFDAARDRRRAQKEAEAKRQRDTKDVISAAAIQLHRTAADFVAREATNVQVTQQDNTVYFHKGGTGSELKVTVVEGPMFEATIQGSSRRAAMQNPRGATTKHDVAEIHDVILDWIAEG